MLFFQFLRSKIEDLKKKRPKEAVFVYILRFIFMLLLTQTDLHNKYMI